MYIGFAKKLFQYFLELSVNYLPTLELRGRPIDVTDSDRTFDRCNGSHDLDWRHLVEIP